MRRHVLALCAAVALVLVLAVRAVLAHRARTESTEESTPGAPEPVRIPRKPVRRPWGTLDRTSRVVILGMPYCGKTWEAKRLTASCERVVYFDPTGHDYTDAGEPVSLRELEAHPELLERGCHVALSVRPEGDTGKELAAELERLVALCREAGDLVLVLDEVGDYRAEAEGLLNKLARNGRHDGIASVYVSQTATDIPRTVRRLATDVISFLQTDPADLKVLAERHGQAFADRAARWRRGQPPARWSIRSLIEKEQPCLAS